VWQSFLSIFPHILVGIMATSQTCCHLPGEMLNSAAECADRAQIETRAAHSVIVAFSHLHTGIPATRADAARAPAEAPQSLANLQLGTKC
jgi:hypothetical protein